MIQKATNGLRFGKVIEWNTETHSAKVVFPGLGGMESDWIPVLVPFTTGNTAEAPLDTGTHVACLMSGEGSHVGVILGAFYDEGNHATAADQDVANIAFNDGMSILYDRKNHALTIDCPGNITITAAGNIRLNAGRIDLN